MVVYVIVSLLLGGMLLGGALPRLTPLRLNSGANRARIGRLTRCSKGSIRHW